MNNSQKEYLESIHQPEKFWKKQAESFLWQKTYKKILEGKFEKGTSRWFTGAKLNITENCLDRHLISKSNAIAIFWEPNDPKEKSISFTYGELYKEVCRMANVLKKYNVKKGDCICIYLPMIPQAVISMLACARIGAIHNVVFVGFSAQSLADRINDSDCKILITSDIGYRGKKKIIIKKNVDEALKLCPKVEKVLIFNSDSNFYSPLEKEILLKNELEQASPINIPEIVKSEDPLFVLYTSGSTGKPKGIIHSVGGYMVYAGYTFKKVFGYKEKEIFWCTADFGWITGHTYGVYGPLLEGATIVLYEGVPTYPTPSRYWQIIEKFKVNIFYTAPTVIRYLESFGLSYIKNFKLKSLRLLGSVGEPLNVEAWNWYHKNVGKNKCNIVDTWWQTETGGILISPQENFKSAPGSVGLNMPGIDIAILDNNGKEIKDSKNFGSLCIKKPWPGMSVGILNEKNKFFKTYFSKFKGYYVTGDITKRDKKGNYYIFGRMDDVINVSGHRLGCAEIESAINFHPDVVESSVVACPDLIKGSSIYSFVVMRNERSDIDVFKKELFELVKKTIGNIVQLEKIQIVKNLPKTRSGKIVRRILRKLVSGDSYKDEDLTTLIDLNVIDEIKKGLCI